MNTFTYYGPTHFPEPVAKMERTESEYFGPEQHISDMADIVANQTDPLRVIGKFDGVWDGELDTAVDLAVKTVYTKRDEHPDYLYIAKIDTLPVINTMPKVLGFVEGQYHAQIQIQRPGCIMPRHIDPINIIDFLPEDVRDQGIRILVMLAPWEHGQLMGFNNTIWRNWEAGAIIQTDFLNTWHFTANCSWHSRPILQISGLPNDRLKEIINDQKSYVFKV